MGSVFFLVRQVVVVLEAPRCSIHLHSSLMTGEKEPTTHPARLSLVRRQWHWSIAC